nr:prolyl oligopeptidase family serine peptidase [Actinoplanes ovalisporus]
MHRRILALAVLPALLAACTAEPAPPSPAPTSAAPVAAAPARAFDVSTRTLELRRGADRPLTTTVWVPEGNGPFPLILFSHGLGGNPSDYRELLIPWARAGFVVAAPSYPGTSGTAKEVNVIDVLNQPADASYVITETLAAVRSADPQRIAAAGHSAGGVTTLGMFSTARDERLRAGLVLAGRQITRVPFTGAEAPLLFVHGRKDRTVTYAEGRAAYDNLTWPKAFVSVTDGGHVVSGRALRVVVATSTDFWRWSLYGDVTARERLKGDATSGSIATFDDDL